MNIVKEKEIIELDKNQLQKTIETLKTCKTFVKNAFSVYCEQLGRGKIDAEIKEAKEQEKFVQNCFDSIINETQQTEDEKIINDKEFLQLKNDKLEAKIAKLNTAQKYLQKASMQYLFYVSDLGIAPYYADVKAKHDATQAQLDLFMQLYQDEQEEVLNLLDSHTKNQNSKNLEN